jgi:hypothetical protein
MRRSLSRGATASRDGQGLLLLCQAQVLIEERLKCSGVEPALLLSRDLFSKGGELALDLLLLPASDALAIPLAFQPELLAAGALRLGEHDAHDLLHATGEAGVEALEDLVGRHRLTVHRSLDLLGGHRAQACVRQLLEHVAVGEPGERGLDQEVGDEDDLLDRVN